MQADLPAFRCCKETCSAPSNTSVPQRAVHQRQLLFTDHLTRKWFAINLGLICHICSTKVGLSRELQGLSIVAYRAARMRGQHIAPTTKPATFAPISPFSTRSGSSSAPRMGLPKLWTCRDSPNLRNGAYAGAHNAPDMSPQGTISPQSAALDVQRSSYAVGAVLPLATIVLPALPCMQLGTLPAGPPLQVMTAMPVLTQCAAAGHLCL